LFPVLKEAGWAHQQHCLTLPLPGLAQADAPVVALAEDTPNGYIFLSREEAQGHDPNALFNAALARLATRPTDLATVSPSIAASAGRDLSAERILDTMFLQALHHTLRSDDLWVCVPHRVALYAVRADAPAADVAKFVSLVGFEAQRGPAAGHAPVSGLAFRVVAGRLREAVPLHTLSSLGSSALRLVPQVALLALVVAAATRGALGFLRLVPQLLGDAFWALRLLSEGSTLALALGMLGARALGPIAPISGAAALVSFALTMLYRNTPQPILLTLAGIAGSASMVGTAWVLRQALRSDAATGAMILVFAGVLSAWVVPMAGVSLAVAAGFGYLAFAALTTRR